MPPKKKSPAKAKSDSAKRSRMDSAVTPSGSSLLQETDLEEINMPPKKKSPAKAKSDSAKRSRMESADTPSGSSLLQETDLEEINMPPKKKSPAKAKSDSAKRSKMESADMPSGSSLLQETDLEESLFESEPPKEFVSSTLSFSSSKTLLELSPNRKRSFRKISVDNSPLIPLNDDSYELIEDKEVPEVEPEVLEKQPEPEPEMSIVQAMTLEQMQEHVSRCIQLSTENKINSKNAFALKLIDCMTIMTKNDDESNFAVMACQLDAGAKIYSHRVDAVHQQVMKLVESCMFAEKRAKKKEDDQEDQSEEDNDNTDGKASRDKKKKMKKKVLASSEQITRKLKEKDPREKFVRLEALPGDILEKVQHDPSTLALTLDSAAAFWPSQSSTHCAPIARGPALMPLPHFVVKNRRLGPVLKTENDVDPSTLPPSTSSLGYTDPGSPDNMMDMADDYPGDENEESVEIGERNAAQTEMEMVVVARSRMTDGGAVDPSRLDVMKALFHQPGESDYHYLKMDNSYYWAGPSYWKRPQGVNVAANKKKVSRKKKEPVAIEYVNKTPKELHKGTDKVVRATVLSRRVLGKWSKKKVTFPRDIHFEPETFDMLFNLDIMAQIVMRAEISQDDPDESDGIDADYVMETGDSVGTVEAVDSNPQSQEPDDKEKSRISGNGEPSGTAVVDQAPPTNTKLEEAGPSTSAPKAGSCDVYEGDNLVPMVKMVKVEPIRYVARPNRVDMGHLKEVMLSIIRLNIEDRENEQRQAGLQSPHGNITFKDVLVELFNSDLLQSRTREDLTVQMCFLCLLTLTNEHSFSLQQDLDADGCNTGCGDVVISYDSSEYKD